MNKSIISIIIILMFIPEAYSQQQLEDVVYLNDGSIIRGIVIEQIPNVSLKIQTRDGNIFVFTMEKVERITKEPRKGSLTQPMQPYKSPGAAFALSFFLPGAGQFYNGEFLKGGIQFGIASVTAIIIWSEILQEANLPGSHETDEDKLLFSYLIFAGNWVWSFVDAPISANRINRERQQQFGHLLKFNIGKRMAGVDVYIQNNNLFSKFTYHF
jgi:hypothetical protein